MTPTQQKLLELVLESNAQASVRDEADFGRKFSEIGIDSLEAMSIMLAAMEKFSVKIADEEVEAISTLGELAELIDAGLSAAARDQ